MANHNAVRAGQAYVEIFADAAKFQQQLRQTESEFRNWGQQMSAIGSSIAASFSMLPISSAVSEYIKFNDAMRSVAAVTGRSLKEIGVSNEELSKRLNVSISDMRRGQFEMESLVKKARDLGQELSYTATEVADAMVILARAGQTVGEIGHTIEAVLDLARATGTGVASTAQFVVGALHEFQMEATQTRRVVDLMTRTANSSPQSLEDLGNALKYIGPVAHSMSLDIEEVMRDLGLLAKFNIRGEQAGTSMRNLYMRMTSELNQSKFKEAFKVDLVDKETGAVRSLLDVLSETKKNIESLGLAKSDVANTFKEVFSLRALPAAFSLIEIVDRAHEMEVALSNARSEAYNARKVMDGGLGGAFRALRSDAQEVGHSLIESIEEPLIKIVRSIERAIEKIDSFIDRNRTLIGGLMKYGTIASGAALMLGGLAVAVGAASKSFSGLLGVTRQFNKAAFDRFAGWGKQLTGRESIIKPESKEPKVNLRPIDQARTSVKALDEKLTDVARITSRAIVRFNNLAKGFYNVASKGQSASNSLSKLSTSVGLSFEHLRKFNSEFLKSKNAYGDARVKISALSRVVQTSSTRFNKASEALQKFGGRNDYVGERVATLERTLLSFREKMSGVQDSVKKIGAAFRSAATEIGQATANYKSTTTRLSQSLSVIASNLNRVVGRLNSGTRSFANFQNAAEKLATSIKMSPSVYQTVEQAVEKFRERVRLASADVREARRAMDEAQKSLNAFGKTTGANSIKTFAASLATASRSIQTIVGTSQQLVSALHASGEAFAFATSNAILYRDALAKIVQSQKALGGETQGKKKKKRKKSRDNDNPPGGGRGVSGTPTRIDRVVSKADEFVKYRNREESVAGKDSVPVSRAEVQRKFGERVARRVDAKYAKRDRKDFERAEKIMTAAREHNRSANELKNLKARRALPGLDAENVAKLDAEIKSVKSRIAGYKNTIKQLQEARRYANFNSDAVSTNTSRDAAERSLWKTYSKEKRASLSDRNRMAVQRSSDIQRQIDDVNRLIRAQEKGYVGKLGVEFARAANEARKFTSANLKLQPAIQAEIKALRRSATLKTVSQNVDARLLDITERLVIARQEEQAARQTYRQNESKRSPLDAARKAGLEKTGARVRAALETLQRTQKEYPRFLGRWLKEYRASQENIRRLEKLYTQPSSASKDDVKLNHYLASNRSKDYNTPEAAAKHKEHIDFLKSTGATQSMIESVERDYKIRSYAIHELKKAKEHQKNVVLGSSKKNLFEKHLAPFLAAKKELADASAERNAFATSTRGDFEQRRTERASDLSRLNTARNNMLALEGELAQALGNRAVVQQATANAERELASATANRVAALNAANAVSNGALGTFAGTPTVAGLQALASESQNRQRALNHESYLKGQNLVSENNRLFPQTPWKYERGKVAPVNSPFSAPASLAPPVNPPSPLTPPSNPPTPPNNPPKVSNAQFLLRLYQRFNKEGALRLDSLKKRELAIQKEIDEHVKYAKSLPSGTTPGYDVWGKVTSLENEKGNRPRFEKNLQEVKDRLKRSFQNALRNSPSEAASYVKHYSEQLGNATGADRRGKQTRFRVSSQLWAESMLRSGKGEDAYQSVSKEIERRGVRYANVMKAFDKRDADLKKQIGEQTKYAASLPAGTTPGHDVWGTIARLENERKENEKKRKRFVANESARASTLKQIQKGLGTGVALQETTRWGEENAAKGRMNRPVADVTKGFDVAWKSALKKLSKVGKLSLRDFNQLSELWSASGRSGTFGRFLKEHNASVKSRKELEDKRLTSKGNWSLYNLHRTQYEESEQKRYALQSRMDAAKAPILRQAEEMRANGASDKAVRAYLQGQFAASGELKSLGQELNATQQASNAALVAMDSAKQKAQKYDKKHGIVSENAGRVRSEAVRAERSLGKADQMQAELRAEEREINRNRDETQSSINDKKKKLSGYDAAIANVDKELRRFQEIENDPLQKLDEDDKKKRDELKRQRDAMEANRNVLQQELEADKQKLSELDADKRRVNQRQQDVGEIQKRDQERLLEARGLGKKFGLDGVDDPKKAQARKDFAEANARKESAKKEWREARKQWVGPDSKFQKGWKAFSSGLTGVVKGLAGLRSATGRAIALENTKAGLYRLSLMGLRGLIAASVKAAAGLMSIVSMSLMGVAIGLVTQALFKFGEWLTKWWKDDPKAYDEEPKAEQDENLQKRDEEANKQTTREEHVRALEELSKQDHLTEENRKEALSRIVELQKNSTGDVDDFAQLEKVKGKDGKESWKLNFDDYKAQSFLSEESKKVNKESENALLTMTEGLSNYKLNKFIKTGKDKEKKEEAIALQFDRINQFKALLKQMKENGETISDDVKNKIHLALELESDFALGKYGAATSDEGKEFGSELLDLLNSVDNLSNGKTGKVFKTKLVEDGLATRRDDFASWKGRIESGDLDAEGLTDSYNSYIDFINRSLANASRAITEGASNVDDINKTRDNLKGEIENVDKAYAQYAYDMGRKIDSERINRKSKNILKVYDEQKTRLETARQERELIANDYGAGYFAQARAAAGSDQKKIEEINKAEAAAKAEAKRLADERYQERVSEINEDIKLETDRLLLSIYSEFDAGYGAQSEQASLAARTKKQSVDGWVLGNVAAYDAETENLRQRQNELRNKKNASLEDRAEIDKLELQIAERIVARDDFVKRYEDEGKSRKEEIDARATRDFEKLQDRQFAGRFTEAEKQMQTLVDNLDKNSDALADTKIYIAGLSDKTPEERKAMEEQAEKQASEERDELLRAHSVATSQALIGHESGAAGQFTVNKKGLEIAKQERMRQLQGMIDAEQAIINKFGKDSKEGKAALGRMAETTLFKTMAEEFYEFKEKMEKAEKKLSLDRFMAEMGTETGELEGVSAHEFDAKKKNLEIDKQVKAANDELDRQIKEADAEHARLLESGDVSAANEKKGKLQQLLQRKDNLNSNAERVKYQNLVDAESKGAREMFEKDKHKQDSVVFGSEVQSSQADIQIAAIESMKTGGIFEEYDKMVDRQANRVRYSKAVSDYESAQSRAGVLNSQAQKAYKIWQDSIKNGASSDEVQENFEKYKSLWQESNSAQKGLQEAFGSARQARLDVIKGEFERKESFSTGTFSAFEAMDSHNDWQKENTIKQTEFLKKICENTELSLWS